jgi:pyruvate dehydrogenase E1 component
MNRHIRSSELTTEFVRHDLAKIPTGAGEPDRVRVIREGVASYLPDIDPEETAEWLESFDELLERSGPSRALPDVAPAGTRR